MIIVMNCQGVLAVGEAALPRQSGEGFPAHSVAPCDSLDLWVIVRLSGGQNVCKYEWN